MTNEDRALDVKNTFDKLIEDMNRKTPEQKDEEAKVIQDKVKGADNLYDGWSDAFASGQTDTSLPKITRHTLMVVGWYGPMTMKGVRTSIYKVIGEKSGAVQMLALEVRRLINTTTDGMGRTVWNITKKGIEVLGDDYSPRGGRARIDV